ncbi:recombination mediator RecR [Malaciobacter marinus]|uniref:Recombination protein RecR n=1 Tax=Malaciobacter marinus TaxID=505249 RepID=A0A347TKB6_9BACT|nr:MULTISPECIES: recombination mediator RecR [Malaciobacter]AXX87044.1 recombination protein [Malaciobacter marinus]PHO11397.1 recombination protein RecR [Malaciobacter marinus]PHO14600.1 recombination protein RecR [Malaciobacter marinus]RYA22372.1 recombination protein RecR [Malaciobacter halophilus]
MKKGLEKFYELVEAFESLPTIGKKSALRLAYHIVMNDNYCGIKLAHSIENAIKNITKCTRCGSMSEHEICEFCLDDSRNEKILCIVQSAKDIFIIEESKKFDGLYFVIEDLDEQSIDKLIDLVRENRVSDILFAITPSLANDAFILFIEDKLKNFDINFMKIAQGVPTGVSLENVDLISLSKAIESKVVI